MTLRSLRLDLLDWFDRNDRRIIYAAVVAIATLYCAAQVFAGETALEPLPPVHYSPQPTVTSPTVTGEMVDPALESPPIRVGSTVRGTP